jgi:hypothetical protein
LSSTIRTCRVSSWSPWALPLYVILFSSSFILVKYRIIAWCNIKKGSFAFFFLPTPKISPMITFFNRNKKKRFHRSTECPCYRAKSLELLNSRLRFYFRIDKERWMLIQIFLLSLSLPLSLSLSLDNRTQSKRKEIFSLLSFIFFLLLLLHPNRGHFVIVQTFIHRVCVVFQIEPEVKKKKEKLLNIYYGNKTFKISINTYYLSFSNRYLFDYGQWSIRFSICLVQWYVYVRINTFHFFLFLCFTRQTKSTIQYTYTSVC